MRTFPKLLSLAALLLLPVAAQAQNEDAKNLFATIQRLHVQGEVELPSKFASESDFNNALRRLEQSGQVKLGEVMRMRFLSGVPATAQIGQRVPRVTGVSVGSRGRTQSVRMEEVGTVAELQTRLDGESGVVTQISYEASYIQPQTDEDKDEEATEMEAALDTAVLSTIRVVSTLKASMGEVNLLHHQGEGGSNVYLYISFTSGRAASSATRSRSQAARSSRAGGLAAPPRPPSSRSSSSSTRSSAASRPDMSDRYEQYARALIERYDKNDDGKLDDEEFAEARVLLRYRDQRKGKGPLTVKELVELLKEAGPGRRPTNATSGFGVRRSRSTSNTEARYLTYARAYIQRYDKNDDGELSEDELGDSLAAVAKQTSWDKNKNGKMDAAEMAAMLQYRDSARRRQAEEAADSEDDAEEKDAEEKDAEEKDEEETDDEDKKDGDE